ncbi:hypothetical protein EV401DRAFT_854473 [Pisolithus croceorrhizus]|nr:hypothetical protein EV401DRAFT_854473 [Pisolithus croceorrhizus]
MRPLIRLVNNVALSCAAFVTYDILTNLDKEITFIWRYYPHTDNGGHTSWHHRARHILVQTLFVFGRYYALLYLVGFFAVNNHQGLSIPLYALTGTSFWDTNHFTPKAARFTSTTSFCDFPHSHFASDGLSGC